MSDPVRASTPVHPVTAQPAAATAPPPTAGPPPTNAALEPTATKSIITVPSPEPITPTMSAPPLSAIPAAPLSPPATPLPTSSSLPVSSSKPSDPSAPAPPPTPATPALSAAPAQSKPSVAVHRPEVVDNTADLAGHTRPRRDSVSDSGHGKENTKTSKPGELILPVRPANSRAASSQDLRSGLASPNIPAGALELVVASVHIDRSPNRSPVPIDVEILYAGSSHKAFEVHKHLLETKVPYFKKLLAHHAVPTQGQLTFEDLDEYGFALFVRWLYGGTLHGPKDFHSMQHYLCLYVLAHRFDVEALCNNVMDLVRAYYRHHSMTAPAYRIEYIYTFTSVPNHMRNFLLTTAAYRCLCDAPIAHGVHVSDSLKAVLRKGGDVAVDFPDAVIKLAKNGIVDVRRSGDCTFHEHSDGKICEKVLIEPYMAD